MLYPITTMRNLRSSSLGTRAEWAAAALLLAGTLAWLCLPLKDPEIFWGLSAGRDLTQRGAFPRADWLSFTLSGEPWADCEWLTHLLWHAAFSAAGLRGLWALKVLLLCLGAGLLWKVLALYGTRPASRGLAMFAWSVALSASNDLSPENLSLIFLIALWGALEGRRLGKFAPAAPWAESLAAFAFFALWSNCHPGYGVGLALLLAFACADLARSSRSLAMAFPAAAAGILANPYGAQAYSVAWEFWRMLSELELYARDWLQEPALEVGHWPFWAILLYAYAAVLFRTVTRRDVPAEHFAALLVLGLLGAKHPRAAGYFVTLGPLIAAGAVPRDRRLFAAALALGWTTFLSPTAASLWGLPALDPAALPAGQADFLERERSTLKGLRIFNTWNWGGYLAYRLHPNNPIYADGRYVFRRLLRGKHLAAQHPERLAVFLARGGMDLAVIERSAAQQRMPIELRDGRRMFLQRPFYHAFFPPRDWALVFWDRRGYVFARRSATPPAWLEENEYRHFRADDARAAQLLLREGLIPYAELDGEVGRFIGQEREPQAAAAAARWREALRESAQSGTSE